MRWLIDSDILIEGERGNALFETWSRSDGEFAASVRWTCSIGIEGPFSFGDISPLCARTRLLGQGSWGRWIGTRP
jgi:hypothetical protein